LESESNDSVETPIAQFVSYKDQNSKLEGHNKGRRTRRDDSWDSESNDSVKTPTSQSASYKDGNKGFDTDKIFFFIYVRRVMSSKYNRRGKGECGTRHMRVYIAQIKRDIN